MGVYTETPQPGAYITAQVPSLTQELSPPEAAWPQVATVPSWKKPMGFRLVGWCCWCSWLVFVWLVLLGWSHTHSVTIFAFNVPGLRGKKFGFHDVKLEINIGPWVSPCSMISQTTLIHRLVAGLLQTLLRWTRWLNYYFAIFVDLAFWHAVHKHTVTVLTKDIPWTPAISPTQWKQDFASTDVTYHEFHRNKGPFNHSVFKVSFGNWQHKLIWVTKISRWKSPCPLAALTNPSYCLPYCSASFLFGHLSQWISAHLEFWKTLDFSANLKNQFHVES